MAKPSVTLRNTKGSALTFTEADTNFTNLRDATITVTDGSNSTALELNGTLTITAGTGISVAESAGTVTITNTASSSAIDNVVEDTSPQLGGNLDVNGNDIVSLSGATLDITADGNLNLDSTTGVVNLLANTSAGGNELTNVQLDDYKEVVYAGGSTTGTITPDVANGNVQTITLTGSITLNAFANAEAGQSMTVVVTQPSSGGPYTLTSTMKFAGGTKTLSTGANEIDIISVFYDGTTYYASLATDFS